jgi:hypothetical protein
MNDMQADGGTRPDGPAHAQRIRSAAGLLRPHPSARTRAGAIRHASWMDHIFVPGWYHDYMQIDDYIIILRPEDNGTFVAFVPAIAAVMPGAKLLRKHNLS